MSEKLDTPPPREGDHAIVDDIVNKVRAWHGGKFIDRHFTAHQVMTDIREVLVKTGRLEP